MRNYFTTGEFARLCGIKKQTLFHYDNIGLLQPEVVTANGYRYYSYIQLEMFHMISMLKELDMPLSEIKKYMERRSPENFVVLLEEQARVLDARLERLRWLREYTQTRLRLTREAIAVEKDVLLLEKQPEEHFMITDYHGSDEDEDIAEAVSEHFTYCQDLGVHSAYGVGGMISVEDIREGKPYNYSCFYTRAEKLAVPRMFTKSAGEYLTCYTTGYDLVEDIAADILARAEKEDRKTGKYFYEDTPIDELSSRGYDGFTVKLSLELK